MDELYREILLDHHRNPRNEGRLNNADIVKRDKNPLCGDEVEVFAKVKGESLDKINFEGKGCIICMASASIMTEELKNKSLREIQDINREDWLDILGVKLTASRVKCAMLPVITLKKAIVEYQGEKG